MTQKADDMVTFIKSHITALIALSLTLYVTITYNACSDVQFSELKNVDPGVSGSTGNKDSQYGIQLNNGDQYTNQSLVNVTLTKGEATEMRIGFDDTCSSLEWESAKSNISMQLKDLNQGNSVYVQFRSDGDLLSSCISDGIVHDDLKPSVQFLQANNVAINQSIFSVAYSINDALSGVKEALCTNSLDAPFEKCDINKQSFSELAEGHKYLYIKAMDMAGNLSDDHTYHFLVDQTAPTLMINSQPSANTSESDAQILFTGSDALSGIARYECKMGSEGAWSNCSSPYNQSGLADGAHSYYIRAFDFAGNMSPILNPAWNLDSTLPTCMISSSPMALNNLSTVNFEFSASDVSGISLMYSCGVDVDVNASGSMSSCSSPYSLSSIADGEHRFSFRSVDASGNACMATYSWIKDSVAPVLTFTQMPLPYDGSNTATFTFEITDAQSMISVDMVMCKLDGTAEFSKCEFPMTDLSDGSHTLLAQVSDGAGNLSEIISYTWIVDTVMPNLNISSGPTQPYTNEVTAEFGFSAMDDNAGVMFECSLDQSFAQNFGSVAEQSCITGKNYAQLTEGEHVFYLRSQDSAGNVSNIETYTWGIDLSGPLITITKSPMDVYSGADVTLAFDVTDDLSGVAEYLCSVDDIATSCATVELQTLSDLTVGIHTYQISATDNVGNTTVLLVELNVVNQAIAHTYNFEITSPEVKPVDILFVVDNSGSMLEEQANMDQRIANFLSNLQGVSNWQIAVVTTDPSVDPACDSCDGKFLKLNSMDHSNQNNSRLDQQGNIIPLTDAQKYILTSNSVIDRSVLDSTKQSDFSNNTDDEILSTVLGATIKTGTNGSGSEQGMQTSRRAIEHIQRANVAGSTMDNVYAQFFRPNSNLAIVMLSDEEEVAFNMNLDGTDVTKAQLLLGAVQNIAPTGENKGFVFHSIVCLESDVTNNVNGCHANFNDIGYHYMDLSSLTGGIIGSVTAPDYAPMLSSIATAIVSQQNSVSLECEPIDNNEDGEVDLQVSLLNIDTQAYEPFAGLFSVNGMNLEFAEAIPVGQFQVDFYCH